MKIMSIEQVLPQTNNNKKERNLFTEKTEELVQNDFEIILKKQVENIHKNLYLKERKI